MQEITSKIGIILGLIPYFGWAIGDIFGIYSSRKVGAYLTTFYVFIFGFLAASLYVPFALNDLQKITLPLLLLNIVFGVVVLCGNFMINEAFKISNASIIGIIIQSFPALVIILSWLIFKDPITINQAFWIVLIFVGVTLCTINVKDLKTGYLFRDRGIRLALVATLGFTIYFTFLRTFIDNYGWFWSNYIAIASFPLALLIIKPVFRIKERIKIPRFKMVILATFLSGVLLRSGDIALNYGVSKGYAAITAPIAGASPTLFVILAAFIFKDKTTNQQKMGILITLIGIVLLSFSIKIF